MPPSGRGDYEGGGVCAGTQARSPAARIGRPAVAATSPGAAQTTGAGRPGEEEARGSFAVIQEWMRGASIATCRDCPGRSRLIADDGRFRRRRLEASRRRVPLNRAVRVFGSHRRFAQFGCQVAAPTACPRYGGRRSVRLDGRPVRCGSRTDFHSEAQESRGEKPDHHRMRIRPIGCNHRAKWGRPSTVRSGGAFRSTLPGDRSRWPTSGRAVPRSSNVPQCIGSDAKMPEASQATSDAPPVARRPRAPARLRRHALRQWPCQKRLLPFFGLRR
jgi:hypothetical protein